MNNENNQRNSLIKQKLDMNNALTIANNLFSSKNYEECIEFCISIIGCENIQVRVRLFLIIGSCYYEKEKYGDSYFYFYSAKTLDPHNYQIYYNLGNVLLKEGKMKHSLKCFKKSNKLNPQFLYSYLKMAEIYTQMSNYPKAIKAYERSLTIVSGSIITLYNLSVLYLMTNNLKKYGKTYFRIGLILKEKNNFNKAISYLLEAYNYIPDNLELTINISEIYRKQEKYKESLGALSKAFKIFPNNYLIFFYAHNIYEEIGDDQTAIEMLKNCLSVNPNFLNAYNSLGNILMKIKKFEDAILIYQSGLNIFPNNEVLLNNLANCYLENGSKKKAKEIYILALENYPNNMTILCNLSIILRKELNYNHSLKLLLKVIELDSKNSVAFFQLSLLYRDLNLYNDHYSFLARSLEIEPDNILYLIELGKYYIFLKDYEKAIGIFLVILNRNSKNAEAFINYYFCLHESSNFEELKANKKSFLAITNSHLKHKNSHTYLEFNICDYCVKDTIMQISCFNLIIKRDINELIFFEDHTSNQIENFYEVHSDDKINIGFLFEQILKSHIHLLVSILNSFPKNKYNIVFFSYQNTSLENELEINSFIVDLSSNDNPLINSVKIKNHKLKYLLYVEIGFNKRIYHLLSYQPSEQIILIPYNATVRDLSFINYYLLNSLFFNTDELNMIKNNNNNNIIFMPKSFLIFDIENRLHEVNLVKAKKLFIHKVINLKNEITNSKPSIIFANFSCSNKFTHKMLKLWRRILNTIKDAILILKFSNELHKTHLFNYLGHSRVIFFDFDKMSRDDILHLYFSCDVYLDTRYSEVENIYDCLVTNLPIVTLNTTKSPPNTKITSSLMLSLGLKHGVVNSYDDYESFVFNLLSDNGRSILLEYKHEMKNLIVNELLIKFVLENLKNIEKVISTLNEMINNNSYKTNTIK